MTFDEYGWHPPKNVYVEYEGQDIPVPEVDQFIFETLTAASEDRLGDLSDLLNWLKSLTDAQVTAGHIYFSDRWTWDSGHFLDRYLSRILEHERRHRERLTRDIEAAIRKNHVMDILDEVAAEQERRENGDT